MPDPQGSSTVIKTSARARQNRLGCHGQEVEALRHNRGRTRNGALDDLKATYMHVFMSPGCRDADANNKLARFLRELGQVCEKYANEFDPGTASKAQLSDTQSPDELLAALKRSGHWSWVQLRRGLLDLLHLPVTHPTAHVRATSLSFARRAMAETGLSAEEILALMDARRWGTGAR
jgi:hypothetical protein